MSLKEQFPLDLEPVFFNPEEFGEVYTDPADGEKKEGRRFAIIEDKVEKEFVTLCVWDKFEVQTRLIVQQQGIYWCDVMLYIAKSCFKVEPKPEEIIYTWEGTFKKAFRVVQVIDAEQCYEIALDKLQA